MRYEVIKLLEVLKTHGKIIVGCDFDDTVFPLTQVPYITKRCEIVIGLLKELRDRITLCMYTVTNKQELAYKKHIMIYTMGLRPDYINKSPLVRVGDGSKPYFNIVLDDKAGLNEAIEILTEFKENL